MLDKGSKIALTGSTGFVGNHILQYLLDQHNTVHALARSPDQLSRFAGQSIQAIPGDLFDQNALQQLVREADAVIHLVGIIEEKPGQGQTFDRIHHQGTQRLLSAAKEAGVRRWIQMSALGTRENAPADYFRTKWLAEQAVRDSGLDYTIFRPSLIHGPDGEFTHMMRDFWRNLFPPFVPYFGEGATGMGNKHLIQPVHVDDVAACFVKALQLDETIGQTYELGGADQITWPQMYRIVRDNLPGAKPKPIIPMPAWKAKMLAAMPIPGLPFNRDQVIMSQEDSICDTQPIESTFGIKLHGFEVSFKQYASQL